MEFPCPIFSGEETPVEEEDDDNDDEDNDNKCVRVEAPDASRVSFDVYN